MDLKASCPAYALVGHYRIPNLDGHVLVAVLDHFGEELEPDGNFVLLAEDVLDVAHDQRGLAHGQVAHDYHLEADLGVHAERHRRLLVEHVLYYGLENMSRRGSVEVLLQVLQVELLQGGAPSGLLVLGDFAVGSQGLLVEPLVLDIELAGRHFVVLDFRLGELVGPLVIELLDEVQVDRLFPHQTLAVRLRRDLQVVGRVMGLRLYLNHFRIRRKARAGGLVQHRSIPGRGRSV